MQNLNLLCIYSVLWFFYLDLIAALGLESVNIESNSAPDPRPSAQNATSNFDCLKSAGNTLLRFLSGKNKAKLNLIRRKCSNLGYSEMLEPDVVLGIITAGSDIRKSTAEYQGEKGESCAYVPTVVNCFPEEAFPVLTVECLKKIKQPFLYFEKRHFELFGNKLFEIMKADHLIDSTEFWNSGLIPSLIILIRFPVNVIDGMPDNIIRHFVISDLAKFVLVIDNVMPQVSIIRNRIESVISTLDFGKSLGGHLKSLASKLSPWKANLFIKMVLTVDYESADTQTRKVVMDAFEKLNWNLMNLMSGLFDSTAMALKYYWGQSRKLVESMRPHIFYRLGPNPFEYFNMDLLPFLSPSNFKLITKAQLDYLMDKVKDINDINDSQFVEIPKESLSDKIFINFTLIGASPVKLKAIQEASMIVQVKPGKVQEIPLEALKYSHAEAELKNNPKLKKLTGLLLGDVVIHELNIEGKSLEGSTLKYTTEFVANLISIVYSKYPSIRSNTIVNLWEQIVLTHKLTGIVNADIKTMSSTYINLIKYLTPGKSCLFPFGWNNSGVGHAMLFQISRLSDENFSLSVFNSGDGIGRYHARRRFGPRFKYLPYLKTKPFELSKFESTNFFETIYGFQFKTDSIHEYTADDLYGIILSRFEADAESMKNAHDEEFFQEQFSGTCSMRVIFGFLHSYLPLKDYKVLKHFMVLENLEILINSRRLDYFWLDFSERFTRFLIKDLSKVNRVEDYPRLKLILGKIAGRRKELESFSVSSKGSDELVLKKQLNTGAIFTKGTTRSSYFNNTPLENPLHFSTSIPGVIEDYRHIQVIISEIQRLRKLKISNTEAILYSSILAAKFSDHFNVSNEPKETLNGLQKLAIELVQLSKEEESGSAELLLSLAKIFGLAWETAKHIDSMEFKDCTNCQMATYKMSNPFRFRMTKSGMFGTAMIYEELIGLFKKLDLVDGGIFFEPLEKLNFISIESPMHSYLTAIMKIGNIKKESIAIPKNLKSTNMVNEDLLYLSVLFTHGTHFLPHQFLVLRDLFIMVRLAFNNRSLEAFDAAHHNLNLYNRFQLSLSNSPISKGNKKYFTFTFSNDANVEVTSVQPTLKIEHHSRFSPKLELNSNVLDDLENSPQVFETGFISRYSEGVISIDSLYDQKFVMHGLFAVERFLKQNRKVYDNEYWKKVLGTIDKLLNNIEPFLDVSVPVIQEDDSAPRTYFEQFVFLTYQKLLIIARAKSRGAIVGDMVFLIRERIKRQILHCKDYKGPVKILLDLMIASYETEDFTTLQIISIISSYIRNRMDGISQPFSFRIDDHARIVHFSAVSRLYKLLQDKPVLHRLAAMILKEEGILDAYLTHDYYFFAKTKDSFYKFNIFTGQASKNLVPFEATLRLEKDKDFQKVFIDGKLPLNYKSFSSDNQMVYEFPVESGKVNVKLVNEEVMISVVDKRNRFFELLRVDEIKGTDLSHKWYSNKVLWYEPDGHLVHICDKGIMNNCIGFLDSSSKFSIKQSSDLWVITAKEQSKFPGAFDSEFIAFADNSENIRYIQYHRVLDESNEPLTFVNKSEKLVWNSNPQFFIGNVKANLPEEFKAYITLNDQTGERDRLILPIKRRSDLLFPYKSNGADISFKYLSVPLKDGELFVSDNITAFYLTYIHMVYHKYEKAWEYLKKVTQIDPFSDEELKYATWIFSYHLAEKEHFPEIYAIEAYVSWLVFENTMTFPMEKLRKSNASEANDKDEIKIESLYSSQGLFRLFWLGEASLTFAKGNTFPMISNTVCSHYYEILEYLNPKMIFHSTDSRSDQISIFMETAWLESVTSDNARLQMISNQPVVIEVPNYHNKLIKPRDDLVNPVIISSVFNSSATNLENNIDWKHVLYQLPHPNQILRPSKELLEKYFLEFLKSILIRNSSSEMIVLFLRDGIRVKEENSESYLNFLLLIHEYSKDESESCKMAFRQALFPKQTKIALERLKNNCKLEYNKGNFTMAPNINLAPVKQIDQAFPTKKYIYLELDLKEGFVNDGILMKINFPENQSFISSVLKTAINCNLALRKESRLLRSKIETLVTYKDSEMAQDGNAWKIPQPEDMIRAFIHGNEEEYNAILPKHDIKAISQIHQFLFSFFATETAIIRLEAYIKQLQSLSTQNDLRSVQAVYEDFNRPYVSIQFDQGSVTAVEVYCGEHLSGCGRIIPALLVFEYKARLTIRKEHIPDLFKLTSGIGGKYIFQRMMSSGKTFVLSTLASILRSFDDRLSILVVPQALLSTNARDIISRTMAFFNIRGRVLNFGRGSISVNNTNLNWLLDQIQTTISRQEYLITSIEHLQSLRSSLIDQILSPNANQCLVSLLQSILKIFRQQGVALVDEVDWTLNPMNVLRFPISDPQHLDLTIMSIIGDVFVDLASDTVLNSTLQLAVDNPTSITPQMYENVKPDILQVILKNLNTKDKPEVEAILNTTDKNRLKELIKQTENESIELFLTLNYFLNFSLPEALGKLVNKDYGLAIKKFPAIQYAKPYVSANTPAANEHSDFSYPIIVVTKTFRTYFQLGLTPYQIKALIGKLRNDAMIEKTRLKLSKPSETFVANKFYECFGMNIFQLLLDKKEDIEKMIHGLKTPCGLRYMKFYLVEFVISKVTQNSKQISSSYRTFLSSLMTYDGYSGSIDNKFIFDDDSKLEANDEIYRIIDAQMKKNPDVIAFTGLGLTVENVFVQIRDQIPAEKWRKVTALLDIGAYFRQFKNLQVAKAILDWRKSINAVLFYDETSNDLYILSRGISMPKKAPGSNIDVILAATGLKLESIFLFLDQRRCTGTDIKLGEGAIAVATISDSICSRDIYQGVVRMRLLISGKHEVILISPNEILPVIKEKLNVKELTKLKVETVFALAKVNSAAVNKLQTSRIFVQKLEDSVQTKIYDRLLNFPVKEASALCEKFEPELVTESPITQYDKLRLEQRPVFDTKFLKEGDFNQRFLARFEDSELQGLVQYAKTLEKMVSTSDRSLASEVGEDVQENLNEEDSQSEEEQEEEQEEMVGVFSGMGKMLSYWPENIQLIEEGLSKGRPFFSVYCPIPPNQYKALVTWKVSEILNRMVGFSVFADLFDKKIRVTQNFAAAKYNNLTIFDPQFRKFPAEVFIIKKKDGTEEPLIIIAEPFDVNELLKNMPNGLPNYYIWAIDLERNVTFNPDNVSLPFSPEELIPLMVQVYVIAGLPLKFSNPAVEPFAIEWAKKDPQKVQLLIDLVMLVSERTQYKLSNFSYILSQLPSKKPALDENLVRGLSFINMRMIKAAKTHLIGSKLQEKEYSSNLLLLEGCAGILGLALSKTPQSMHSFATGIIKNLIDLNDQKLDNHFLSSLTLFVPSVVNNDLFFPLMEWVKGLKSRNENAFWAAINWLGDQVDQSSIHQIGFLTASQFLASVAYLSGVGVFEPKTLNDGDSITLKQESNSDIYVQVLMIQFKWTLPRTYETLQIMSKILHNLASKLPKFQFFLVAICKKSFAITNRIKKDAASEWWAQSTL